MNSANPIESDPKPQLPPDLAADDIERVLESRVPDEHVAAPQGRMSALGDNTLRVISAIELQLSDASLDAETALQMIADCTLDLTRATGVAIGLLAGDDVLCRASAGAAPCIGARLDREKGLSGECLRTGKIIHCADTASDPRVNPAACRTLNLRSAVAVPVFSGATVFGIFDVFSNRANAFDQQILVALSQIAHLLGRVINKDGRAAPKVVLSEAAQAESPIPIAPAEDHAHAQRAQHGVERILLSEYFLIALAVVALAASVAGSYRAKKAARTAVLDTAPVVQPTPPLNAPAAVAAEAVRVPFPPPAQHNASPERAKDKPAADANPRPATEQPTVASAPQPVEQLEFRNLETPPEPPNLAFAAGERKPALGTVIAAPVALHAAPANPKPGGLQKPTAAKRGKLGRVPRALGSGATKPVRAFFGLDEKKPGETTEPQQTAPPAKANTGNGLQSDRPQRDHQN